MLYAINYKGQNYTPSKIICVARNYAAHAKELGNDLPSEAGFFLKPNSALTNTLVAHRDEPIHYEAEIAFLIKDNSYAAVAFGLDLTKREKQAKLKNKGLPWERSKAFDGSALVSEFVELDSTDGLSVELYINDALVQQGNIEQMIFGPEEILTSLSDFMSLEDGDIILSGTPEGVGEIPKNSSFKGLIKQKGKVLISQEWKAE